MKHTKQCLVCNKDLVIKCERDMERKKFCCHACRIQWLKENGQHWQIRSLDQVFKRKCRHCGSEFESKATRAFYCSKDCQNKEMHKRHKLRTSDLEGHLKRLLIKNGKKVDRTALKLDDLMALYAYQGGKCALTGMQMTWEINKGNVQTNVSIDKIDPNKGYNVDNIQLVCRIANTMKFDSSMEEFIELCKKVVEYADKKRSARTSDAGCSP